MKLILCTTILFFSFYANAQKGNLSITQRTGVNISSVSLPTNNLYKYKSLVALNAGIGLEYYILNKISASTEVFYNQIGFHESHSNDSYIYTNKTNFIDIPVIVRYYICDNRLNMLLGGQIGIQTGKRNTDTSSKMNFNQLNWGIPIGIGYNFKFGLLFEARYTQGVSNIFPDSRKKTTNRSFSISCGYKFNLKQ
ncbi:MAG: porin family protein [Bacteroidales bacterium]